MTATQRTIQLTPRELELLLKYGYLSEDQAAPLRTSPLKNGWYRIRVDPFWASQWIGNLVHSGMKIRSRRVLEELNALCAALERGAD